MMDYLKELGIAIGVIGLNVLVFAAGFPGLGAIMMTLIIGYCFYTLYAYGLGIIVNIIEVIFLLIVIISIFYDIPYVTDFLRG